MTKKELHKRFAECGKNIKKLMRECALMLPEIDRQRIWKKEGFGSIYEYAAKLANMSRYQVELALWTVRKIEHMPALLKVAREKGIHAVRPVANVATEETAKFWADKAENLTVRGLETYVRETKKSCHVTSLQPAKSPKMTIKVDLPEILAKRLDQLSKRADFEKLLGKFLDEVEQEGEKNKPESVQTKSRHIPAKIRKYVTTRTNNKCAYSTCKKPIYQLHHTERWALKHAHDPDRLQPLCKAHNELAHRGLIENEEKSPISWRMREQPDRRHPKFAIDQKVASYARH
jgi:hypothetical protein